MTTPTPKQAARLAKLATLPEPFDREAARHALNESDDALNGALRVLYKNGFLAQDKLKSNRSDWSLTPAGWAAVGQARTGAFAKRARKFDRAIDSKSEDATIKIAKHVTGLAPRRARDGRMLPPRLWLASEFADRLGEKEPAIRHSLNTLTRAGILRRDKITIGGEASSGRCVTVFCEAGLTYDQALDRLACVEAFQ